MIANFVGLTINGKPLPTINELYPSLNEEEKDKDKDTLTKAEYNRAMLYKEQFIDFANRRNKQMQKEGK